ncbi:unnamed protein product [Caenorhabditis auriculariae]|uniref:Uncharacterized protein n=1 Tax=Caenorhabditis auriculariae TaxID=2777116 RepID=A0A8S1GU07_9PELO|nr:unnamed protein product [Caenorhabditis auriculariae]
MLLINHDGPTPLWEQPKRVSAPPIVRRDLKWTNTESERGTSDSSVKWITMGSGFRMPSRALGVSGCSSGHLEVFHWSIGIQVESLSPGHQSSH